MREEGKEIETETVGLKKRVFVPAREGRGVGLRAGERFRVVDLEGMQAGDLFAFNANDSSEYASAEHTRVYAKTPEEARNCRLFPRVGGYFVTNRREPILYFEEDHSPGQHDMLVAACDAKRYELLGHPGHDSCVENLERVMAEFGYEDVQIPQPINFFANFPVHGDGTFTQELLQTKPGDYVTLRAEMDAIVILSACPHDVLPVYGPMGPTSMAIEVLTDA